MADMIKKQYLGGEKLKKKMLKPSEKFKFNFDWEAGDDTSKDLNPLYNNTHEAQLLFGRGLRAGVDRREQKKVGSKLVCSFPCTSALCLQQGGLYGISSHMDSFMSHTVTILQWIFTIHRLFWYVSLC